MSQYYFIATRDPVSSSDSQNLYGRARDLAKAGELVSVWQVQNGVLGARLRADSSLREAHEAGVRVCADEFSLRERGIALDEIQPFVEPISVEAWLARVLADGTARLIWH